MRNLEKKMYQILTLPAKIQALGDAVRAQVEDRLFTANRMGRTEGPPSPSGSDAQMGQHVDIHWGRRVVSILEFTRCKGQAGLRRLTNTDCPEPATGQQLEAGWSDSAQLVRRSLGSQRDTSC